MPKKSPHQGTSSADASFEILHHNTDGSLRVCFHSPQITSFLPDAPLSEDDPAILLCWDENNVNATVAHINAAKVAAVGGSGGDTNTMMMPAVPAWLTSPPRPLPGGGRSRAAVRGWGGVGASAPRAGSNGGRSTVSTDQALTWGGVGDTGATDQALTGKILRKIGHDCQEAEGAGRNFFMFFCETKSALKVTLGIHLARVPRACWRVFALVYQQELNRGGARAPPPR